jgi:hypothetical protein
MPYHPIILQLNQNNTKNTNNYVNGDGQHKNQDNQKYSKINGRWLCPARFETKNSLVAWKCLLLHARAGYQLCRVCSSMRRINCLKACCICLIVYPARFERENLLVTWKNLSQHAQAGYQFCRICASVRRIDCVSNRAAYVWLILRKR